VLVAGRPRGKTLGLECDDHWRSLIPPSLIGGAPIFPVWLFFTPQRIYLGVRMEGIETLAFSLFFLVIVFVFFLAAFRTLTRTDLVLRLVYGGANGF